ncbi:MAG TPA: hypothetical protein VK386_09715 [Acidimicrobiales bacterium]|nr:hypothetical protein [Acidimicrobiales bacterium]
MVPSSVVGDAAAAPGAEGTPVVVVVVRPAFAGDGEEGAGAVGWFVAIVVVGAVGISAGLVAV